MVKELNDTEHSLQDSTNTVYEVSYLLLPSLSIEQVPSKVSGIKEAMVKSGAVLISDEDPILIPLAYPMTKVIQTNRVKADQGYFGWVKFEMSADSISNVKKFFDNNSDILRHLIIKTVRENTLLNGKMKLKSEDKTRKGEEMVEDVPEVLKEETVTEELDKTIDDLVVV